MLTKLKNMNKQTKSNAITYGIVVMAYIAVKLLISTNNLSSLMRGLLVPLCTYAILAVSLNLVVGFLG